MRRVQRREFIKLAGLGAVGTALSPRPGKALPSDFQALEKSSTRKPNIIFILSDDHAPEAIGAYDLRLSAFCREQNVTPNLDRLATQGALFQHSFCGNSVCSPSRATILTGLHSHANGVRKLDQEVRSGLWKFPMAFRTAGYQSAVFGKWHLGRTPTETDYWCISPGQGRYLNPVFESPTGAVSSPGHTVDVVTDLALKWLEKRDPAKPFLLMVYQKPPHRNWIPPERYAHYLEAATVPEPATLFDDYANRGSPLKLQKLTIAKEITLPGDLKIWPEKPLETIPEMYRARNEEFRRVKPQGAALVRWKYQMFMKDYLRCVKSVDDSVGRLTDYLEQQHLADNTVVIYASDQGFYLGEHGWFDKRWIFEESIHMPFIIRWPGVIEPGNRPDAMIQNIDYALTFVEIAGGTVPPDLHGRSFLPVLCGKTPADWRTSVYYRYYDPGCGVAQHNGVRTKDYTLVHYFEANEWDLFDLKNDPQQMHSVYADPAKAGVVQELKMELERLRQQYGEQDAMPYPPEKLASSKAEQKSKPGKTTDGGNK